MDEQGAPLEERLRTMILSNVTISDGQTSPRSGGRGHSRGNNHQRRPYHRGRGFHHHGHNAAHHSANQDQAPSQRGRGGRYDSPPVRGNHTRPFEIRQPQSQLDHSGPGLPIHHQGDPSTPHRRGHPTKHQNARSPRHQPDHTPMPNLDPNMPDQTQTPRFTQTPRIMQRSQDHANAPLHSPRSPRMQGSPRYHRFPMHQQQPIENPALQIDHLDAIASQEVPKVEISVAEIESKEAFRKRLEELCKAAIADEPSGDVATISLTGFGSLASGFGMPGSDMDLAVVPVWKNADRSQVEGMDKSIPRRLEKAVLDCKMGGRLLTRTRVPILKVCQEPTEELFAALDDERKKWDALPDEEKYPTSIPLPDTAPQAPTEKNGGDRPNTSSQEGVSSIKGSVVSAANGQGDAEVPHQTADISAHEQKKNETQTVPSPTGVSANDEAAKTAKEQTHPYEKRPWLREKVLGPLDFPKSGVGIQCDINFENPLGLHNTHLLRCYSSCDPRVRLVVLFVKSWAKRRKVNSSYSGTLSSYGWVLMVLHYLVNVASPPVCPNLQLCWRPPTDLQGLEQMFKETKVGNWAVRFWRDEEEIIQAAQQGQLTQNTQTVGALLRGFYYYYASPTTGFGPGPRPPTFFWTKDVLSLRTLGGIRSKEEKGWTGARTTNVAGKEVRHRYLFAIEDPFELDHNVARTVTHNGIVAIRDEFRRAWRILSAVGRGMEPEGGLFDDVIEQPPPPIPTKTEDNEGATTTVQPGDENTASTPAA